MANLVVGVLDIFEMADLQALWLCLMRRSFHVLVPYQILPADPPPFISYQHKTESYKDILSAAILVYYSLKDLN
jgi:hypothetical protein